ncbi:rho/rac/cdc gtpase-activating protein [Anaeramoeba ignava]|uniref:Rho/rac/cdc gtpase-activating protein n=1 Tax=Anaeramoeba ignava TaxID=1746090 RepID=A0A9Q0LEZ6_ANAIG|nr:rho/rac/cdc gtpase-activating protein [Anaeramoeba ignava]
MSAIFLLTITFPYQQTIETMKFSPLAQIKDVISYICKSKELNDSSSYGLFCPSKNGFWLKEEETLMTYQLWKERVIEFKTKLTKHLKVIFKGDPYIISIDERATISQQMALICRQMGIDLETRYLVTFNNEIINKGKSFLENKIQGENKKKSLKNFKPKKEPQPIFGKPIINALNRGDKELKISVLISKTVKYIEEHGIEVSGIYRESGRSTNIQKLKSLFDESDDVNIEEFINSPHDASGLLKSYLRELPDPLLTYEFFDKLKEVSEIEDKKEKMERLKWILQSLPTENFELCKVLFEHLHKISQYEKVNRMGVSNLSVIMGPNILKKDDSEQSAVLHTSLQYTISNLLISEYDYLFFVIKLQANILNI